MTQKLDNAELQTALALSQAACYASMSAKEHREGSAQANTMFALTEKLCVMTLAALDAAVLPEIVPVEGEPTLADIKAQTIAAAATGAPAPEIVMDMAMPGATYAPVEPAIDTASPL